MIPLAKTIIPKNANESIYEIMQKCALSESDEYDLMKYVESKNMIWVWQGYRHKMSESALFHELTHLAIRAVHGEHGDPDHEGPKYRGWSRAHTKMIVESKQMLRAFEL